MRPDLWGPGAWHLLHTVAYSATPDARRAPYRHFFRTYETIIPCHQCQFHYGEWLETNPLEDVEVFPTWVNNLHNHVCRMLRKDEWSSGAVRNLYFKDGVIQVSHDKIFKWIDVVVETARENTNISDFQDYIIFFNTLRDIFPCPSCSRKLRELMEEYPITEVTDAKSLQDWYGSISVAWKHEHRHLDTNIYLIYSKSNSKRWFSRRIKKRGTKYVQKIGDKIVFTLDNGKKREIVLPRDMIAGIATEADIDYIKKISLIVQK